MKYPSVFVCGLPQASGHCSRGSFHPISTPETAGALEIFRVKRKLRAGGNRLVAIVPPLGGDRRTVAM
jgi:hypothetical protein